MQSNIEAKVIAHSKSSVDGSTIATFELTYPRFIHSELLTHRLFSRNAASSRAIPFKKMVEQVETDPAHPEVWGLNKPGMQATEVLGGYKKQSAIWLWNRAAKMAAKAARALDDFGLHKQIVNRVLEPFVRIKTVVTATEWENYWWLRCHTDAQPEIRILAEKMREAVDNTTPVTLKPGEWHLPYYEGNYGGGAWKPSGYDRAYTTSDGGVGYARADHKRGYTLDQAQKISASCCAQVSFRKNDGSLEKAERIQSRLIGDGDEPCHASPFEHAATPMKFFDAFQQATSVRGKSGSSITQDDTEWEEGVTHCDRDLNYWSANFKGWIQHRQLIDNHVVW